LATDGGTGAEVRAVIAGTPERGLVLDGGALDAVAVDPSVLAARVVPAVLTPHDGELARLIGRRPGPDRIAEVRDAAARLRAVVLAKGPTTVAADPAGQVLVSTAGDQRLASAGTGDVLAGLVGACLAGGLAPLEAAGLAAELHGRAARAGHRRGFVASDLPLLVADYLER
jgi:NAD(P)H-hydrate epimerase